MKKLTEAREPNFPEKLADEPWVAPRSYSLNLAAASRAGAASGEQTVRFPLGRSRFGFLFLGPEGFVCPVAGEPGLGLGDRLGVTAPAGQVTFLKLNGLGEVSRLGASGRPGHIRPVVA